MAQQVVGQTIRSSYGLKNHGFSNLEREYWNLTAPALYEQIIRRREGILSHLGPIVVRTGTHTGRSPNDKFAVREPSSESHIWWGSTNRAFEPERFDNLHRRLMAYFQNKEVYVQDCYAGADPRYRLPIRVIGEQAWHNLFARVMFIRAQREELGQMIPEFTIIQAPRFEAIPEVDGTTSGT